jgi:hypothetical protein
MDRVDSYENWNIGMCTEWISEENCAPSSVQSDLHFISHGTEMALKSWRDLLELKHKSSLDNIRTSHESQKLCFCPCLIFVNTTVSLADPGQNHRQTWNKRHDTAQPWCLRES